MLVGGEVSGYIVDVVFVTRVFPSGTLLHCRGMALLREDRPGGRVEKRGRIRRRRSSFMWSPGTD